MSFLIFGLWYFRVLTISIDNPILRYGVPLLTLALILAFVLINTQALPKLLKNISFRYFLFLFAILIGSTAIAYLNNMPLMSSVSALLKFLLMGGFFALGYILALYGKQQLALFLVASTALCHLLAGLFGYFLGYGEVIQDVLRPTGIAGKVNILANLALFMCVFYGVRGFFEKQNKVALLSIALLALVMIFFSGTLKNVVSLIGAFGVYALLGAKRKFLTITVMILVFVPTVILLALYTPIGDRIIEAFVAGIDVEVEEGQKLESSLQWRMLHWKLLFDDWVNRFLFLGAGFGQVGNMNALKTVSGEGFQAHSDWVQFWVELGPIMFFVFIWGHFKMLQPLYEKSKEGNTLALALFFAFVSQSIAMLAGPVYFSVSFFYYFWLLLGIISADVDSAKFSNNLKKADKLP